MRQLFVIHTSLTATLQGLSQFYFSYENQKNQIPVKVVYISPEAEYMPPLVYSRENSDKIVFRIKAAAEKALQLIQGEHVIVTVGVNDD